MRFIGPLIVLTALLTGLIFYRMNQQELALAGPSGGSGEIEATTVDLSSRVAARVTTVFVKKGERIKKGELVLRLDCSEPNAMLAEAKARLEATRAQAVAASAQVGASQKSRQAAVAAGKAASSQAEALQAQKAAAERQAARLESLPEDVPASNVDQVRSNAQGLAHQVEAAKAQAEASSAQARAAAGTVQASGAQAKAALAQVTAAEAAVARAELLVAECELRSPLDAEVQELPYEPGELTTPGSVLARLVSFTELKATFYLPNAELARVKPGAAALVVADAWPKERFGAKVNTVGFEAEFTPRNIQTRSDRDRLVYPVEVVLENAGDKLRPGMPVQVTLPGTEHR